MLYFCSAHDGNWAILAPGIGRNQRVWKILLEWYILEAETTTPAGQQRRERPAASFF